MLHSDDVGGVDGAFSNAVLGTAVYRKGQK